MVLCEPSVNAFWGLVSTEIPCFYSNSQHCLDLPALRRFCALKLASMQWHKASHICSLETLRSLICSLPTLPYSLSIYEHIRRSTVLMFRQVPTYYIPVIVHQSVFHFQRFDSRNNNAFSLSTTYPSTRCCCRLAIGHPNP